jgi:hypothetical protein
MEYIVEGHKYNFSYQELKEAYIRLCELSDEEFMKNISGALHLACVICFWKEIPSYLCLSDKGIIHELVHLLHIPDEPLVDIKEIRKLFKEQLKLS